MIKKISLGLVLGFAVSQAAYQWSQVQIQGGGYVPGIVFHPTAADLAYIRTDVGGTYKLDAGLKTWTPLNDMFTDGNDMGTVALAVDPADASYVYSTGGLSIDLGYCGGASFFRSANKGASWTKISLNTTTVTGLSANIKGTAMCLGGNAAGRGMGNRIAVNGSTIYLGTNQNGLLKSTDRGNTWSVVSSANLPANSGVGSVVFDAAGNLYAAPYGGGVYKLASGGTDFVKVGTLSAVVYQMAFSPKTSEIWLTTNTSEVLDQNKVGGGVVYKYTVGGSDFSAVTMPAKGGKEYGYLGISVNPNDGKQILVATGAWWKGKGARVDAADFIPGEAIFMTLDGGANWTDILANGTFDAASAYNAATSNPHWISALAVNPGDKDHVVFGTGYGVWSTFNATDANPDWIFTDKGIEETVPLALASSTYGAPLVSAIGDIDGFYHTDLTTPPLTRHKVEDGVKEAGTNYDLDWAGSVPSFMVREHKEGDYGLGGYSMDGGKTWKNFASKPPFVPSPYDKDNSYSLENNHLAVSADAKSIVWVMQKYGVYYSKDSGKTWTPSTTAASNFVTDTTSLHVVSDRKTAGTYYIFNPFYIAANDTMGVVFKSVDHGANWTKVNETFAPADGNWANGYFRIFASPDAAGELWLTAGAKMYACNMTAAWKPSWCTNSPNGYNWYGGDGQVWRSTNGGTTFTAVKNLLHADYIAFGKGAGTTSAVYAKGVDSTGLKGIFRSLDQGSTWTRIDDAAHQYGSVNVMTGDPCIYSRLYLGTGGRGIVYGEEPGSKNTCADRIDYGTISAIGAVPAMQTPGFLYREGMSLRANGAIVLYDLTGKQVGASMETMGLAGLQGGLYLARSGSHVLKVNLH